VLKICLIYSISDKDVEKMQITMVPLTTVYHSIQTLTVPNTTHCNTQTNTHTNTHTSHKRCSVPTTATLVAN